MKQLTRPEVVVITGASAGVGRATARAFAREGASIGLLARGRDGLEAARREVEGLGGRALDLQVDVADADAVERAAEADAVAESCNANRIAVNMGEQTGKERGRSGKTSRMEENTGGLRGLVTTV